MNDIAMRLLLILNENPPGAHDDVHRALARLTDEGTIASYYIYPFLARFEAGLSSTKVNAEILARATEFQPTAILWSHTVKLRMQGKDLDYLKGLDSKPVLGYWDGDIYQRPIKSLPREIIFLAKNCAVSFWPGYCEMIKDLRSAGCQDIRYVPLTSDEVRFGSLRSEDCKIIHDVVMVGNYVSSRIPWRRFPGSRWRQELAKFFYKKLGPRFAVYGNNWRGPYAKGPVPFKEQNKVYHRSRLAIGVNNIHARYFFSNRLPIAMTSGVIMVHNYEEGYDEVFEDLDYPYFFNSTKDAWHIVEELLSKRQSTLDKIGNRIHKYAMAKLTMYRKMKFMIEVLQRYKSCPAEKRSIKNPWISVSNL